MSAGRANVALRVLALGVLCAVVYGWGLTSQGLVNWQESTRALVAREMQASGEWLAPTMRGRAYIAKPPMIYWAQMALAGAMGQTVGEWHLRAVAAIAGTLGVVGTYLVGRRMFRDGLDPPDAERAAWWSAVGLAVSILYVRSSRTGELDILLPMFTVLAVGATHLAWSHFARTGRTHLGAVALTALWAIGAGWSKGPPALACIAAAMLLGPLLWASGAGRASLRRRGLSALGACALVLGAVFALNAVTPGDAPGLLLLILVGGVMGWCLSAMTEGGVFRRWFGVLARTHPVAVLGAPVAVLWAWGRHLERVFGAEVVAARASAEVSNNLNLFVPGAIEKNIGFLAYGAAPIVVGTVCALVLIVRERPNLSRPVCLLLGWLIGGFVVFSIAGKGVARYLTPLWPACALLGGWFIAGWMARMASDTSRRRASIGLMLIALVFASAQAWWYGFGRGAYNGGDSIRSLAGELAALDARSVATWKFDDPALDLYLGRGVEEFAPGRDDDARGLRAHVELHGPLLLLMREQTPEVVRRYGDAMAMLGEAGLRAREVPVASRHVRPPGEVRVRVYEVSLAD